MYASSWNAVLPLCTRFANRTEIICIYLLTCTYCIIYCEHYNMENVDLTMMIYLSNGRMNIIRIVSDSMSGNCNDESRKVFFFISTIIYLSASSSLVAASSQAHLKICGIIWGQYFCFFDYLIWLNVEAKRKIRIGSDWNGNLLRFGPLVAGSIKSVRRNFNSVSLFHSAWIEIPQVIQNEVLEFNGRSGAFTIRATWKYISLSAMSFTYVLFDLFTKRVAMWRID